MLKTASTSLREILEYGDISEVQTQGLYDTLAQVDMYPGFDRAMQGERCCSLWVFDLIRKEPDFLWNITGCSGDEVTPINKAFHRVLVGIGRPLLYANEMVSLEFWGKQIELARLPYRKIHSRRAALDLDSIPFYASFFSAITCPVFINATAGRDAAAAEIGGSRIFLALIAYKDRFGAYPASLDELRAGLGWDIPKDIFSDKDFIYKNQGSGFLLYSVGENFKDDGGRPKPVHTGTAPYDKNYDIIWKMDH